MSESGKVVVTKTKLDALANAINDKANTPGPKTIDELVQTVNNMEAETIVPSIGENGNWYIEGTDTGKPSRGETGPQGPAGPTPIKGTDYFTEADEDEIAAAAAKKVNLSGKQDKIMANGILKGNGSGGVTVAVVDEDYTKYGGICLNVQHVSEGVYSSSVTLGTLDLYALRLGADEESNYSIFARVHNADYEFTWYALSHYMGGVKAIFSRVDGRTCDNMILTADGWTRETHTAPEIPIVGVTDDGKFLRVVDGAWAAVTIPNANGGNF